MISKLTSPRKPKGKERDWSSNSIQQQEHLLIRKDADAAPNSYAGSGRCLSPHTRRHSSSALRHSKVQFAVKLSTVVPAVLRMPALPVLMELSVRSRAA